MKGANIADFPSLSVAMQEIRKLARPAAKRVSDYCPADHERTSE